MATLQQSFQDGTLHQKNGKSAQYSYKYHAFQGFQDEKYTDQLNQA